MNALLERLFSRVSVDEKWLPEIREHASNGTVVHVLRSASFVDLLALEQLTQRHGLPAIHFTNDPGLRSLNPVAQLWNRPRSNRAEPMAEALARALRSGSSAAALFLRRPPTVLESTRAPRRGRGVPEGDELIDALLDLQRQSSRPIYLVPEVFVWTKRPDTRGTRPLDLLLGPREWPSPTRVLAQFLSNYGIGSLRAGAALNLAEFLKEWPDASRATLRKKLVYTMLRRLERERRSVTGPVDKAPDRVRQEILKSRRFQNALAKFANTPEQRQEALRQADEILRKMQALPDGGRTHRALEVVLDRLFQRIYHGLDVDQAGLKRLAALGRDGNFVLLPSHKSHIDYLVVSYVFFKAGLPLPLIVAGENLSFFPMGGIFRRGGAFFIRRSFGGDRLYAAVVDAYVRRQIKDGYAIELFLEGMRSRTGKFLSPKFGLLSMIVSAVLSQDSRQVFFVPLSIGYERLVDAESHSHEITGGEKIQEDAAGLLSATEVLRHRYGRINLQVGTPLTLRQVASELGIASLQQMSPKQTRNVVVRLGNQVMDEIARITSVTPGALTALALLNHHRRGLAHDKLVLHCERLLGSLVHMGARLAPGLTTASGGLQREAIRQAAQMFADAGVIELHALSERAPRRDRGQKQHAGSGAMYTVVETKRVELDTSKNIIIHFFVWRALVSTALLAAPRATSTKAELEERVSYLARLLKHEFRIGQDAELQLRLSATLDSMCARSELSLDGTATDGQPSFGPGPGLQEWSGHTWLLSYASMIRNFLEGYRIFLRSCHALLAGSLTEKELVKKGLATGQRMYLAGEIERPEAISKPILQNALLTFQEQGVVRSSRGQLLLAEESASVARLEELEAQLSLFLEREGAL